MEEQGEEEIFRAPQIQEYNSFIKTIDCANGYWVRGGKEGEGGRVPCEAATMLQHRIPCLVQMR